MPIILETSQFIVQGHDQPHHHRDNGGHVKITPKEQFADRTAMPMTVYMPLMQLVMLTGEAITTVLKGLGMDVARINYQDNGNWSYFPDAKKQPQVHVHLYVRTWGETHPENDPRFKAFPDALSFPYIGDFPEYYRSFQPYTEADCQLFKAEMAQLLDTDKYCGLRETL